MHQVTLAMAELQLRNEDTARAREAAAEARSSHPLIRKGKAAANRAAAALARW